MTAAEMHRLVMPPITTTQLVQYAGASGDFHRIHYDHPFALEAGLGGVIAHGMLTMAFMARAVTEWAGDGAHVEQLSARFTAMVRPGDVVEVQVTIAAREADGRVRCGLLALVGDKTVAQGEAQVRPAEIGA